MSILLFYALVILAYFFFEHAIAQTVKKYIYEDNLELILKITTDQHLDEFQNLRYKKMSQIVLFGLLFPLLKFNVYFILTIVIASIYSYKLPYLRLNKQYKHNIALLRFSFPVWLRQIQILLYNHNVINAIELTIDNAPHILSDQLESLVKSLKKNPNDLDAFNQFMIEYRILEIDRAMKLLYRAYTVEQDDTRIQLSRMIESTTKWMKQERRKRNEAVLKQYEWLGILPLLSVTVIFMIMMVGLINNLFGKGGGI
ncbi:MAG: hypothetical protein GX760_04340 [Erysipelothrix sp.]|nr:hypothetical protein [Erysipelothrix sp.]